MENCAGEMTSLKNEGKACKYKKYRGIFINIFFLKIYA